MAASPRFRLNGGAPCAKASVAAGSLVTATLEDRSGVDFVEWSILTTDETSSVASYSIAQSGPSGSCATWKALGPGTAGLVQARINGGLDKATQMPKPSVTLARAKFYVPTAAGREVLCAGETLESDPSSNFVGVVNALIRGAPDAKEGVTRKQLVIVAGAFTTREGKDVPRACGACFFERGSETRVRLRAVLASSHENARAVLALYDVKGEVIEGCVVSAAGVEPVIVEADITSALAAVQACVVIARLSVEPTSGEDEAVVLWAAVELE